MLEKHRSQIEFMREHYGVEMVEDTKVIAKYRGFQCGVKYAEGYRVLKVFPRLKTERELP
jgi:hypothetical protein